MDVFHNEENRLGKMKKNFYIDSTSKRDHGLDPIKTVVSTVSRPWSRSRVDRGLGEAEIGVYIQCCISIIYKTD